jgi:hypothetical protein
LGEPNVCGEPESRLEAKSNELDEPDIEVSNILDVEAGSVTAVLVDAVDPGVIRRHPTPPRTIITARTIARPTIVLLLCGLIVV